VNNIGILKKKRLRAAAFVDYEHWYISMEKIYGKKPDIGAWVNMINERADVREITFFADFSNESLNKEISKIREYTNRIVETKNPNPYSEKDFTDFIMLDSLYQKAFADDKTDVFILFTGDAHFNSVAAYLKTICRKQVGIYGVKGAFSNQLKATASWWVELPTETDILKPYYDMILKNLRYLEMSSDKNSKITFRNTVQTVADHCAADKSKIQIALQSLIDNGYIQRIARKNGRQAEYSIKPDWEKLSADGLWVSDDSSGNIFIKKSSADAKDVSAESKPAKPNKQQKNKKYFAKKRSR
jgi:hypothetical protein